MEAGVRRRRHVVPIDPHLKDYTAALSPPETAAAVDAVPLLGSAEGGAALSSVAEVSAAGPALGALAPPELLRKSVTYQPEPLSWKPAAVTCLL
jgi:hypothetical protein